MKHITKLLLTIIVTFMLIEVLPINQVSAESTVNEASVAELIKNDGSSILYATIERAFEEANNNKHSVVKLLKDCKINQQLEVKRGGYFTLDLNGHTIDAQKKDRLIYIYGCTVVREDEEDYVGHLIITDNSTNHNGALINGYRASGQKGGSGIEVVGELEFLGGTIRDCRNDGYYDGNGAAIYVEGGSLAQVHASVLMSGNAKIENCYAEGEGGAVFIEKYGIFRMDGGTITGCHADCAGGGVALDRNSTFELNGGSINNCYVKTNSTMGGAYDGCGGGVFAFSGSMVVMRGGEISYCNANKGGGIFLKQGFKDTDFYYYGSQGFLEGGTISNNRALVHGGGVFVQTGENYALAPAEIAKLHLNGGISIDNNGGIELKDGPVKDNVYLELKMNSGSDGYRPYFYVDGNLSGRVGINADNDYYGQISFEQDVAESQLEHLFSDDNGKVVAYRDNKNYLDKGHATILYANLITWDSDRVSATVDIDRNEHSIRIYAARQKNLDDVFDYEKVELIWRGGRLKEEGTNGQTYYDNPHELKIFGPANREEQRCYYQRVTVFDSREVGQSSYSETWDVRIYFQNSLDKLRLRTKLTKVYERKVDQYDPSIVSWEPLKPDSVSSKGVSEFYVYRGTRLRLEMINNDPDHQVFERWSGGSAIQMALSKEHPPKKATTPFFYNTDPIVEFTIDQRTNAYPRFLPIEKQYTVNVVNGYLNKDTTKISLTTKAGETINAQFKAPTGVDADSIRFVKWETSGTFKLDDSIVKNENITFAMPEESFTLTGIYETRKQSTVTYHTVIDGVEQTSSPFSPISENHYQTDIVEKQFEPKIVIESINKYFVKFATDNSDVSINTKKLDDKYQCSFVMPKHNVDIYVHYYSKDYELVQVNTTTPGMEHVIEGAHQDSITAAAAPAVDMVFDRYELSSNGVVITDKDTINKITNNTSGLKDPLKQNPINIVMPSHNLTITAKYRKIDYTLRQIKTIDSGDSIHNMGDVVVIRYKEVPNYYFKKFTYRYLDTGVTIANPETTLNLQELDIDGKVVKISMPNSSIVVEAIAEYAPIYYKLIQIGTNDEGISEHLEGGLVDIKSNESLTSKKFSGFIFYDGIRLLDDDELDITVVSDNHIRLKMPNFDLTVVALYEKYPTIKYTLTQIGTLDDGVNYYAAGTENISIDSIDILGSSFTHFDFYKKDQKLEGDELASFISEYVTGSVDSGHVALKMPNYNLTVKANYDSDPSKDEYPLTQIKTYNEGTVKYKQGTQGIHIKALDIDKYTFQGWKFSSYGEVITGTRLDEFLSKYVEFTTGTGNKEFDLKMPRSELTVEALFNSEPVSKKYTLVEENTIHPGTSQYRQGTKVDIKALSLMDKEFNGWEFYWLDDLTTPISHEAMDDYIVGGMTSLNNSYFTLKMPADNLKVKATYKAIVENQYTLVQKNTVHEGESKHYFGTKINIRALEIPGYSFNEWEFYEVNGTTTNPINIKDIEQYIVGDLSEDHFTLIMPRINKLIVEATFKDEPMITYNLRQINTVDEGEKSHYEGEKINIEALEFGGTNPPTFKEWKFYDYYEVPISIDEIMPYISGDISSSSFVLTMPDSDLTIEATYNNLPEDTYDLTQINTNDEGTVSYYPGTKVTINAINSLTLTGWKFYKDGLELTEEDLINFKNIYVSPSTLAADTSFVLTMPDYDLIVEAEYSTTPPTTMYTLTQIKTVDEGVRNYREGTQVHIKALDILGYDFAGWVFKSGAEVIPSANLTTNPSNITATDREFTLTMPGYDLTVEATYDYSPLGELYTLTTENTTYDGGHDYHSGTKVEIEALTLTGFTFKGWNFYSGTDKTSQITGTDLTTFINKYVLGGVTNSEIVLIMPSHDVYVEATYNESPLPSKYNLTQIKTVEPGTVAHFKGTKVDIEASELVYGTFNGWTFRDGSGTTIGEDTIKAFIDGGKESLKNSSFTLTMPGYPLTVEALYTSTPIAPHNLTTINASPAGTNQFYEDTEIEVKADEISGKIFDHFRVYKEDKELIGDDLTSFINTNVISKGFDSGNFILKMPDNNLTIESTYREPVVPTPFKLTQVKTVNEGVKEYLEGTHVSIQAQKVADHIFDEWKFYDANGSLITRDEIKKYIIGDITSDNFVLVMPKYDLKVEATFTPISIITPHLLKQINTVDEGVRSYYAGTKVKIVANNYGELVTFKEWKFYNQDYQPIDPSTLSFDTDISLSSIVLNMPDYHLIVEATYHESPIPVQHKLTLIGTYNEGVSYLYRNDIVSARRLNVTSPITFVGWEIYKNDVLLTESTDPKLSEFIDSQVLGTPKELKDSNFILMPDYDLTIKAVYKNGQDPVVWHKLEQVYTVDEGSSMRQKNDTVTITAVTPTSGISNDGFKYYKCVDGIYSEIPESAIKFDVKSPSSITFKMPDHDLKVVAQFKPTTQKYELTAISTNLSGDNIVISMLKDVNDSIAALPKGTGTFEEWLIVDSDSLEEYVPADKYVNPTSHELTFSMPAKNITIAPVFKGTLDGLYWIDVINGYANGEPYDLNLKDEQIIVEASEYDGGNFARWKVYKYVEEEVPPETAVLLSATPEPETEIVRKDISSDITELNRLGITDLNTLKNEVLYIHQPDFDIELVAEYETDDVHLIVVNGIITSDGSTFKGYKVGSDEIIRANPCPSGMMFSHWRVIEGNPIWYEGGQYLETAKLKLVDDVKVEAVYILRPPYVIPPTGVK